MKKVEIKPLDLEIESQSPALSLKYDKQRKRLILAIDQTELSHTPLKDTGGDPHPQYLDMIRHRAMDHSSFAEPRVVEIQKGSYFFERYDDTINVGCMGYTVPPVGEWEIKNILVATKENPSKLKYDILFQGTSIFTNPIEDAEFLQSTYGRSKILKAHVPSHDAAIVGPGLLEVMILEAEDVTDLLVRIELV